MRSSTDPSAKPRRLKEFALWAILIDRKAPDHDDGIRGAFVNQDIAIDRAGSVVAGRPCIRKDNQTEIGRSISVVNDLALVGVRAPDDLFGI